MNPDFRESNVETPFVITVSSASLTRYTISCRWLGQTYVFLLRDITRASLLSLRQELGKHAQSGALPSWAIELILRALMNSLQANAEGTAH